MIQVIHRALNILELIAREPIKEIGLSEIADELKLNHSTCANILKTLMNRGYVEQTRAKKGYKLGYMAYRLTNSNAYNAEILNAAQKPLEELSEKIDENVILSIISNDKRLLLKEISCSHELQPKTSNETTVYRTTTGRMILAYYSTKELLDYVKRVGLPSGEDWPEVKTSNDLRYFLNEIKENEILITQNKNHVVGLATPIFKNNKVVASIGVYLPSLRYGTAEKNKIIKSLKVTTEKINKLINE